MDIDFVRLTFLIYPSLRNGVESVRVPPDQKLAQQAVPQSESVEAVDGSGTDRSLKG